MRVGDEIVAALSTILEPEQDSEARRLVRAVVGGLADTRRFAERVRADVVEARALLKLDNAVPLPF